MPQYPFSPLWLLLGVNALFYAVMVSVMLWESRGSNRITDEPRGRHDHGGDDQSNSINHPGKAA